MKLITMTAYRRPDYTQQVVDGLRECIGIEDYVLMPFVDDGNNHPEVVDVFRKIDFMEVRPHIQEIRVGCNNNTYFAMSKGFALTDFLIHLEDDTVIVKDALKVLEFLNETYADRKEVIGATTFTNFHHGFVTEETVNDDSVYQIGMDNGNFTAWCCATWKDRWKKYYRPTFASIPSNRISWDTHLFHRLKDQGKLCEVKPYISRCQNIGLKNGTYMHDEELFYKYHHVRKWAPDFEIDYTKPYVTHF